ncbi:hypothetical protein O181_085868, partial [Austropuccinia psidii MF-1]|nr:hypothetical protein [Austropuccinia psidii MF-1]
HSSHKSKREECQPRAEAQMEDARDSTSSQRLASTFDTLIESKEADITSISVVRPKSLSTGNNRDIPVSIQELVYGSKTERVGTSPKSLDRHHKLISSSEEVHGARKDRGTSEGLETHVLPGEVQQIKAWLKIQITLSEDQKTKLAQEKENSLVEDLQASTSAKEAQATPKNDQKGKKKVKPKWNKPYPQNYRNPKKEKTAMDNVFNMARTLMEFKNKEEERLNHYFPKK